MTTRVCPHCGVTAHFTVRGGYGVPYSDDGPNGNEVSLWSCDHCHLPLATLSWQSEYWFSNVWPQSVVTKSFPDVPDHIAAVAIEAHNCSASKAPRAAVTMARATVEAMAKDKGITSGRLVEKIDVLHAAGHISEAMRDAAHEIRFAGNEAAHADIVHESINAADAEEIVELMDAILERVYEEPAQVERVRRRRQARTTKPTPEAPF